MRAIKFGGAVLRDRRGFESLSEVLSVKESEPTVAIVSAFGKATKTLIDAARAAEDGSESDARDLLSYFFELYREIAADVLRDPDSIERFELEILTCKKETEDIVSGVAIIGEASPRTLDRISSYGERLASGAATLFLIERGFDAELVPARNLIVTDSNFGAATPDLDSTKKLIEANLKPEPGKVIVTEGFVAADSRGRRTSMGTESSNLSAAIVAEFVGAEKVEIFTDSAGVRSADPKFCESTIPIERLSYERAKVLGKLGLKLAHHPTIEFAERYKLPIEIKSAFDPDGDFTVISGNAGCRDFSVTMVSPVIYKYFPGGLESTLNALSGVSPEAAKSARIDKLKTRLLVAGDRKLDSATRRVMSGATEANLAEIAFFGNKGEFTALASELFLRIARLSPIDFEIDFAGRFARILIPARIAVRKIYEILG